MYLIYKHTNNINGKVYIGQTKHTNPNLRWQNGNGYKNQYFYEDIQKYGWDNFTHEILEQGLTECEADEKERLWIQYFHSDNPQYGYNRDSGRGGKSPQTIQKMKQSWDNPIRKANQAEVMRRINANKDYYGINNPMFGKIRSGKLAGNKRRVQCINTGVIFDTVTEASLWCCNKTTQKSHIAQVCNGSRKSAGKHPETNEKLRWRYLDEY